MSIEMDKHLWFIHTMEKSIPFKINKLDLCESRWINPQNKMNRLSHHLMGAQLVLGGFGQGLIEE